MKVRSWWDKVVEWKWEDDQKCEIKKEYDIERARMMWAKDISKSCDSERNIKLECYEWWRKNWKAENGFHVVVGDWEGKQGEADWKQSYSLAQRLHNISISTPGKALHEISVSLWDNEYNMSLTPFCDEFAGLWNAGISLNRMLPSDLLCLNKSQIESLFSNACSLII